MTTLILKGKIVGDTYLFTSHEKSWYKESGWDEEDALDYRIELNIPKNKTIEKAIELINKKRAN